MSFGKSLISEKNFSSSDLIQYIEILISRSKLQQRRTSVTSNYGWLRSRNPTDDVAVDLEQFNNKVLKLTSESCAAIAVKLDRLTDETKMLPSDIVVAFSKLLDEEENIQMLERNFKNAKERRKISKINVVEGKRNSLSFIFK